MSGALEKMRPEEVCRRVETLWRMESAKIIGALTRLMRDLARAEELAHDALVAALEQWPRDGVPDNPAAWLMTTAKRRAIDVIRQHALHERKASEIGFELETQLQDSALDHAALVDAALDDRVGDDMLRLIFISCHPLLPREARTALTLRLIGGLTTSEIARAFFVPEPTIAQRIVRAKRSLSDAKVPFELPAAAQLPARLSSVLEVIYLIFNEGYAATSGDQWMRPALCEEALRLGRVLAELMPVEPEVLGLSALMEIQASRLRARVNAQGEPVLLLEQDRSRWDRLFIHRGLAALERAQQHTQQSGAGPYLLQAAIAACHARANTAAETNWPHIVALYDALLQTYQSPVIELNRAVAVAMASGPAAGLALVEALAAESQLLHYYLLHSVRGDLLFKLGRLSEARAAFEQAAQLTLNKQEQALLLKRVDACR